ncbi:MAG: VWA domain-containing protein, partial [Pseudomonadota bacterium]
MTGNGLHEGEARRQALDAAYTQGFALWQRAELAACVFLVEPHGLGGIHLRSPAGPVRDTWLSEVQRMAGDLPHASVPAGTPEGRLIGGVSIEQSLRLGTLVSTRGLLAEANGGVVILRMADQLEAADAAPIAQALEQGEVRVERAGTSRTDAARFGLIALDEGEGPDETTPANLTGRLCLHADLFAIPPRCAGPFDLDAQDIEAARKRLGDVTVSDDIVEAIVGAAATFQIPSLRAPLFCLRAARALAALEGRAEVNEADAKRACDLTLAHLATLPAPDQDESAPPPPEEQASTEDDPAHQGLPEGALEDQLIEAVRNGALLGALQEGARAEAQRRALAQGRSGAQTRGGAKGRPDRPRPARGRTSGRIDLLATLRAAAPWQTLRGRGDSRLKLRPSDLHVKRHRHRAESSVIFVVDASGSAALNRLAEVKGAIELLLSECYARRDHVSLIAFRGETSEALLPPTRSLTRVRRALAGLPA